MVLARLLQLPSSNVNRALKELIVHGLCSTRQPSSRAKARLYQITKLGRETLDRVDKVRLAS